MFLVGFLLGCLIPMPVSGAASSDELANIFENFQTFQQETRAMIHEFQSSLGQLVDRVTGIESILEAHTSKGERKLGNIEGGLGTLSERVTNIENILDAHTKKGEGKLGNIEELLGGLSTTVSEIETTLRNHVEKGEKKLAKLPSKFAEQTAAITGSIAEQTSAIDRKFAEQAAVCSSIANQVSETLESANKVKNRQEARISEIRLISLYKLTSENRRQNDGYDSDLVTDGKFTLEYPTSSSQGTMRAHTLRSNRITVHLGGRFRIHNIKIWNMSNGLNDTLSGADIYADTKLIAEVAGSHETYDFVIPEDDPTYADMVYIQGSGSNILKLSEVQIWGSGPFLEGDEFA